MTQPWDAGLDGGDRDQLVAVDDLLRGVLGADVVGAWLYGSAAAGGLRPSSDLDVFVVTNRALTAVDRRALIDGLLPISGSRAVSGAARSIELTTVVQSAVRPWRYPPLMEFLYGDWLRAELEGGEIATGPRPNRDLVIVIAMLLLRSRTLIGRPASEVLEPVPRADLERASLDVIPGLLDDLESDTRNVLLTLARIWTTVATGQIRSKDAAADWVLARLPEEHRAVLARARAAYRHGEHERWNEAMPEVRGHADFVVRATRDAAVSVRS